MTTDDKNEMENYKMVLTKKEQNISIISGKIDKFEHLIGEEILLSNHRQIIEQAKFAYSPVGKAFKKQKQSSFSP